MAIIDFDYLAALWWIDEIEDLGDDIDNEINRMQEHLGTISREWKGPASQEYQKQLQELIKDLCSAKTKIYDLANKVRDVAEDFRDTDERIAENVGHAGGGGSGGGGSSRSF